MKKATAAANKKIGKIYECSFCMAACNDNISAETSDMYMGRSTGKVVTTYFCSDNCACANYRAENTETINHYISASIKQLNLHKPVYLLAIRGDLNEDKKECARTVMIFNYLSSKISFAKSLLARNSNQEELTLKWFKCKKYIGEIMEEMHDYETALDLFCNELEYYGNPMNIQAYAK